MTIEWEMSKYYFSEQDGLVMVCASVPDGGMLSSDITVTNVQVEGLTATCKHRFLVSI